MMTMMVSLKNSSNGRVTEAICLIIIAAWAELNHRNSSPEAVEASSPERPMAMDIGNPWDAKPLAASTEVPFDNPFGSPSPKVDEGWANFKNAAAANNADDSIMSPIKTNLEAAFEAEAEEKKEEPTSSSSPSKASSTEESIP